MNGASDANNGAARNSQLSTLQTACLLRGIPSGAGVRPSSCPTTGHSGRSALLSTESRPAGHALRRRLPALRARSCPSSPSQRPKACARDRRGGRKSRRRSGKRMSAWQVAPASGCTTMRTRCWKKRWVRALRASPFGRRRWVEGRLFSFSYSRTTRACHVSRRAVGSPAGRARCGLCAPRACVAWTARTMRWPFCLRPPLGVSWPHKKWRCRTEEMYGNLALQSSVWATSRKGYHRSTNSPSSLYPYPKCHRPPLAAQGPRAPLCAPILPVQCTEHINQRSRNRNHPKNKESLKITKKMTLACSVLIDNRKKSKQVEQHFFSSKPTKRDGTNGASSRPSFVKTNVHDTYTFPRFCECCEICGPAACAL